MILNGFRLICCQCGSDNVLEKSGKRKLDCKGNSIVLGEGVERKCLDCSNESFVFFRTWLEKTKNTR